MPPLGSDVVFAPEFTSPVSDGTLPDDGKVLTSARLCARLSGKVDCQPTHFTGNRLAQRRSRD